MERERERDTFSLHAAKHHLTRRSNLRFPIYTVRKKRISVPRKSKVERAGRCWRIRFIQRRPNRNNVPVSLPHDANLCIYLRGYSRSPLSHDSTFIICIRQVDRGEVSAACNCAERLIASFIVVETEKIRRYSSVLSRHIVNCEYTRVTSSRLAQRRGPLTSGMEMGEREV